MYIIIIDNDTISKYKILCEDCFLTNNTHNVILDE